MSKSGRKKLNKSDGIRLSNTKISKMKKSIDSINSYLLNIRESFQSDLNIIENDIDRVSLLISEAQNNKQNIESTFDSSYMILSSSQVAKIDEYAELDSFNELIETRKMELEELNEKKKLILLKIEELEDIISCAKEIEESVV